MKAKAKALVGKTDAKTEAPKPKLSLKFVLPKGALMEFGNRLTPLPVDAVPAVDFLLSHRTMPVKRLKPKVVAQVALELAREFSIQSDRFRRMAPQNTPNINAIMQSHFGRLDASSRADLVGVFSDKPILGVEVTIPASDGYHHGEESVSPGVCLAFAYDGRFILGKRSLGKVTLVTFTTLDEKKLTALVKRFPDLTWVLTMTFFPHMMEHLMSDIEFAHRHMKDFQKYAGQVASRLSFRG